MADETFIITEIDKLCSPYGIKSQILYRTAETKVVIELYGKFPGEEVLEKLRYNIMNTFKEVIRVVWRIAERKS